jgi:hypothetical protein
MSADTISGISVIQRSRFWQQCPIYRVGHMLHHADGRRSTISLCMTEGAAGPGGIDEVAGEPVWQFIKGVPRHGWIACKPSVRQFVTVEGKQVDLFHNTYDWQVQYVEMRWPEPGVGQQPMQIERYDVLTQINDPELTDAQRAAVFDALRRREVIY